MKIRKILLILFTYCIVVLTNAAFADITLANDQALTKLITEIAPNQNSQEFLNEVKEYKAKIKPLTFPKDDKAFKDLDGYAYDSIKNPQFKEAYAKAFATLPKAVQQKHSWAKNLDATAVPNQYWDTPLGKVIILSACQQHNCPNNVNLVYDLNSKLVWGLFHDNDDQKFYLLGNPSKDQLALLMVALGEDPNNY